MELMDERQVGAHLTTFILWGEECCLTIDEVTETNEWMQELPENVVFHFTDDYDHGICDITGQRSDTVTVELYW